MYLRNISGLLCTKSVLNNWQELITECYGVTKLFCQGIFCINILLFIIIIIIFIAIIIIELMTGIEPRPTTKLFLNENYLCS